MDQTKLKSITISELYSSLKVIQTQLDKLSFVLDKLSSEDEDFKKTALQIESYIRESNVSEMKLHGETSESIVTWYCDNYPCESILVTTPNGDHPIDYTEWSQGRQRLNKEVSHEFYKDFMKRVIEKGGYIQIIPF